MTSSNRHSSVTMVGTITTTRGISMYCDELAVALSEIMPIQVIGFRELYPRIIFPIDRRKAEKRLSVRLPGKLYEEILCFSKPKTWFQAALNIRGNILHLQWWSMPLLLIYLAIIFISKLRKKIVITTIHNVLPHELKYFGFLANKLIITFSDHLIVHSEENKSSLHRLYNIPESIISVVPHGLLTPVKGNGSDNEIQIRKQLGITEDAFVILFLGHIRRYKGLDDLIKAFSMINNPDRKWHLLIAGQPWENWDYYERLIQEYGIQESVSKILEYVPENRIEFLFHESDLVVLPYREFDAQSGVALMALKHNKPMIVTDVGGLPEVVLDKRAIAKAGDPKSLADTISSVINDEQLISKLKEDGIAVSNLYAWSKIAMKTVQIYNHLLK